MPNSTLPGAVFDVAVRAAAATNLAATGGYLKQNASDEPTREKLEIVFFTDARPYDLEFPRFWCTGQAGGQFK